VESRRKSDELYYFRFQHVLLQFKERVSSIDLLSISTRQKTTKKTTTLFSRFSSKIIGFPRKRHNNTMSRRNKVVFLYHKTLNKKRTVPLGEKSPSEKVVALL
jgi:hypothetical protein